MHEGFARFFERPSRESLRDLLQYSVGETDRIDFKESLPEKTKLAKHLLAFANSGGGVIILGVKDGVGAEVAIGLPEIKDKADIKKQVMSYLPSSLLFDIIDFSFSDSEYPTLKGKTFQVIIVESKNNDLPYICEKEGDDIKANVIYVRKGTNTTEATHDDVQRIVNQRIDSKYSSTNILRLEEHLGQLKVLYGEIPTHIKKGKDNIPLFSGLKSLVQQIDRAFYEYESNPNYPKESYQEFIARSIEMKKAKIRGVLEV